MKYCVLKEAVAPCVGKRQKKRDDLWLLITITEQGKSGASFAPTATIELSDGTSILISSDEWQRI